MLHRQAGRPLEHRRHFARVRAVLSAMAGRALSIAGLRERLGGAGVVTGAAANFMSLGSQVVIQLLSVPVLMAAYGIEDYGVWLLFITLPTYITMSDLGLVTAATNEMAIRWGRGDNRAVLSAFQSVGAGMAVIAVLVSALSAALIYFTAPIEGLWPEELAPHLWVIPILCSYAALFLLSQVPVAAFRATGLFARGTLLGDGTTFVGGLAMLATATITHDMTHAAAALLVVRAVAMPLIYLALRRSRPIFRIGGDQLDWQELRTMLPSALGVLTMPGSLAISLQGTVLVIGAMLGPAAVAVFASVRTASRFSLQIATMIVRAIVPELASAHGREDAEAKRRFWKLFERLRLLILVPAALAFALLGGWAVEIWSLGRLEPSPMLVAVMGLALIPHGVWFLDFFMLTATHQHISLARPILAWSLAGLGLTAIAIAAAGLVGAAASVLLLDVVLAVRVRQSIRRRVLH